MRAAHLLLAALALAATVAATPAGKADALFDDEYELYEEGEEEEKGPSVPLPDAARPENRRRLARPPASGRPAPPSVRAVCLCAPTGPAIGAKRGAFDGKLASPTRASCFFRFRAPGIDAAPPVFPPFSPPPPPSP